MAHRRLDWKVALALGVAGVWLGRRLTRRRYNLRGKTVLICGGARGFGLALARAFGARGGRLALLADDGAELAHAASELRSEGIEAWVFPCDVRLSDQVQRALREVVEALGPIDVLVNNAGATALEPRETMLLSDYQEAMDTHFFAPLSLVQAVLPAMRARGEGRIVNIASPGGKVPSPASTPRCGEQVRTGRLLRGPARRGEAGWDRGHHRVPGRDAARERLGARAARVRLVRGPGVAFLAAGRRRCGGTGDRPGL